MRDKGKRVLFLDSELRVVDVVRYDDKDAEVFCPEGCAGYVPDSMGMFQIGDIYKHLEHRNAIVKFANMRDEWFLEIARKEETRGRVVYSLICHGYDTEHAREVAENDSSIIANSFVKSHFTERYQRMCYSILWMADLLRIPPNVLDDVFELAGTINLYDLKGSLSPSHYKTVTEYEAKLKRKKDKESAFKNLTVEVGGKVFDADDISVMRIHNALLVAGGSDFIWKLADNTVAEVTQSELVEVLRQYHDKVSRIVLEGAYDL